MASFYRKKKLFVEVKTFAFLMFSLMIQVNQLNKIKNTQNIVC